MAIPLFNVGGLASGLDTNSIIEQLVEVERIPLRQLEARKSSYEDKDAAWSSLVTRFSALQSVVDKLKDPGSFARFGIGTASSEAVTVTSVNDATPQTSTFTVNELATAHQLLFDAEYSSPDETVGSGDFTITVDDTDYVVTADGTTTLEDLAGMISSSGAGVSGTVLKVDEDEYRLVVTAQNTGAASEFEAEGQGQLRRSDVLTQGQDAEIEFGQGGNAITVYRDSNTVSDLVSGVTLTLNEATTEPVTVTVTRDEDAAVEAIQGLVSELNAVMSELQKATDYNVEAEKAAPLQGDSTARSLETGLRAVVSDLYDSLSGEHTFAASVGLTLTREGTFDLDVDKLREQMADDFPPVAAFFEGDGTATGLAAAIDEFLDGVSGTDGSIQRARDRWRVQIDDTTEAIQRMEDRVDRREAALIAQFARLETSMSQLSGLAASLSAALPGLQQ